MKLVDDMLDREYLERLDVMQEEVNPKPSKEAVEKLKKSYLEARENGTYYNGRFPIMIEEDENASKFCE